MTKELNGAELAGFIQERQAKQVRMLRQAHGIVPRLVIMMTPSAPQSSTVYVRMKRRYAKDILIDTVIEVCEAGQMQAAIERWNADDSVQGIIVQLPLDDITLTETVVNTIAPEKDVDGLGVAAHFVSATADAINWLLGGYGVVLDGKKLVVLGQGRLVGAPLTAMWQASGYDVTALDVASRDIAKTVREADIIVTATGSPRLVTTDMVKSGAVVVDAGTATEGDTLVGDVDDSVRTRQDVTLTPTRGGVGPLTIALLFDHLIQTCLKRTTQA